MFAVATVATTIRLTSADLTFGLGPQLEVRARLSRLDIKELFLL